MGIYGQVVVWESVGGKLFGGDIRRKGGIWVNKSNNIFASGRPGRSVTKVGEEGEEMDQTRGCKVLFKLI